MPETDKSTKSAVEFALLQQQVTGLQLELAETNEKLESLQKDRDRALLWGIMVLGTAVLSMGTWIFHRVVEKLSPVV